MWQTRIKMIYKLGKAEVAIGLRKHKESGKPIITIARIPEGHTVGDDLRNTDVEETDGIAIIVENLEGLAVLEKAVKMAKEFLIEKEHE